MPGLGGDKKYTLRNTVLIYGYTIVHQVYLKYPIILSTTKKKREGRKRKERREKPVNYKRPLIIKMHPDFGYIKILNRHLNKISYIILLVFWHACLSSENIFSDVMSFRWYAKIF